MALNTKDPFLDAIVDMTADKWKPLDLTLQSLMLQAELLNSLFLLLFKLDICIIKKEIYTDLFLLDIFVFLYMMIFFLIARCILYIYHLAMYYNTLPFTKSYSLCWWGLQYADCILCRGVRLTSKYTWYGTKLYTVLRFYFHLKSLIILINPRFTLIWSGSTYWILSMDQINFLKIISIRLEFLVPYYCGQIICIVSYLKPYNYRETWLLLNRNS